ncbi:MAG: phage BR0599 family protein, partial [Pseudomonadota bacterium]
HGIEIGDTFLLTAGCDKYLDTCASKFTNHENFRGFPFMPGNDVLTRVGRS